MQLTIWHNKPKRDLYYKMMKNILRIRHSNESKWWRFKFYIRYMIRGIFI